MTASNQSGESTKVEINSPESWENAKAYASMYGAVPSSFSANIRTLILDQKSNEKEISHKVRFQIIRLLNGPTMKSMFYHACRTFRPEQLQEARKIPFREMLSWYEPMDVAGIIAVIYLYRRLKKVFNDQVVATASPGLQRDCECGGYVGDAIPRIGIGTGMLVSCMRQFALAAFQHHDEDGFARYQKHLDKFDGDWDIHFEASRWNCTSLQVASILLQSLGFGIDIPQGYVHGLDPRYSIDEINDDEAYRLKIIAIWNKAMLETGQQPEMTLRGAFYPLQDAMVRLQAQFAVIKERGTALGWMEKTKDDLSPENTPHIWQDPKAEKPEEPQEQESSAPKEYPPQLLEFFSDDELQKMTQEQINQMSSQLDLSS